MRSQTNRDNIFRSWLEEHQGILTKVASSFAASRAEFADLRQEVLLQLWLSVPSFDGRCQPSTWIYRVCLNTVLAWKRKQGRHERARDDGFDLARFPAAAAGPAESAAERELIQKLYGAIRSLSKFDRALVLLMLDELSYREIAEITGMSEGHVGVALTRARKRLAAAMKGVIDELE